MFVFAHTGIGNAMVRTWRRDLPRSMVLLGALLPDLLDKPVYYTAVLFGGPSGHTFITGTRTLAHTGLFLLVVSALALVRRSKALAAVALGVMTHLILDAIGDSFGPELGDDLARTVFWPLLGWEFPRNPHATFLEHLSVYATTPFFLAGEVIGALLLVLEFRARPAPRARAAARAIRAAIGTRAAQQAVAASPSTNESSPLRKPIPPA